MDFETLRRGQTHRRHRRLDALLAADQHRRAKTTLSEQECRADRLFLLALRKDDASWLGAHSFEDLLEPGGGRVEPAAQRALIGPHVKDRLAGDTGVHRRL